MLQCAFDAQVPAAWVTGESVYGDDRRLRVWLEECAQAYGWPSRARRMSGVASSSTRSTCYWPLCLLLAGPGSVPARERRGAAEMSGVGCPWRILGTPRGAGGCEYGGA